MRILMISPTSSGIGGIAQHVQGLKNFLENKGNDVEIISSNNTFTIPIKGLKNPSFMISSYLKSKFKNNFDIVHAQNPISAVAMKNIKGKKILSLQGNFSEQISLLHGKTAGSISSILEKNALKWADAITVPSKEMLMNTQKMVTKLLMYLMLLIYHRFQMVKIEDIKNNLSMRVDYLKKKEF